jgi:ribosomal protein L6P/L9E
VIVVNKILNIMIFLENRKKYISFKENKLNYKYAQIIIWGLNFSFRKMLWGGGNLHKIELRLDYSYNMAFELPKGIVVRLFKRRLVFYGHTRILVAFINKFTSLRSPNIYTCKGLRYRPWAFRKKPGKVRKR